MYGTNWGWGLAFALLLLGCSDSRSTRESQESSSEQPAVHEWRLDAPAGTPNASDDAPQSYTSLSPHNIIFENNRSFTDASGQQYQIKIRCFYLKEPERVAYLSVKSPCQFDVVEEEIYNTSLTISVFRNRKLLFDRIIPKRQFEKLLDRRFLKTNVPTGADLFAYNEKLRRFIFLINLAQNIGGTEWYAQVYQVYDEAGNLSSMGLVDYPYHCEQMIGLSENENHLITCSEMLNLTTGRRHLFKSGDVVLSRFLNDTSYTVVYDMQRDSVRCDTLIYHKNDTLYAVDRVVFRDSLTPNAYIFHVNGDTLATFSYHGYINGLESYLAEVQQCQKLPTVAFFDRRRQRLQLFDLGARMKRHSVSMNKIPVWKASDTQAYETLEFRGLNENHRPVRLHLGPQNQVLGYTRP